MELLCTCGALSVAALPGACKCPRCGRVWAYERTEYASDWRCFKEPAAPNATGPWPCPVCGHRLDCQGILVVASATYDLFCHHCHAHITLRIKP